MAAALSTIDLTRILGGISARQPSTTDVVSCSDLSVFVRLCSGLVVNSAAMAGQKQETKEPKLLEHRVCSWGGVKKHE